MRTQRRNRAVDGLKVICALVVMLHHIPALGWDSSHLEVASSAKLQNELAALDNNLPRPWTLSNQSKIAASRHLRANKVATTKPPKFGGLKRRSPRSKKEMEQIQKYRESWLGYFLLLGVGPGKIAVDIFLLVSAFSFSSKLSEMGNSLDSNDKLMLLESYGRSLINRFPRLCIPLLPVHFICIVLFLVYGKEFSGSNINSVVVSESYMQGLPSLFNSILDGPLWILHEFLFLPFFVLALEIMLYASKKTPGKQRLVYLLVFLWAAGNIHDETSISPYITVVLGSFLARIDLNSPRKRQETFLELSMIFMPWYSFCYAHAFSLLISAFGLTLISLRSSRISTMLSSNYVQHFAPLTYQIYIWHLVVYKFFKIAVNPLFPNTLPYKITTLIAAFIVVIFVSKVGHELVEKKFSRII